MNNERKEIAVGMYGFYGLLLLQLINTYNECVHLVNLLADGSDTRRPSEKSRHHPHGR